MTREMFVAWRDPIVPRWLPVGKLSFDGRTYQFVYTRGAEVSDNFLPFGKMTDTRRVYESDELFPMFANRILSKGRPEYKDFLSWLDLDDDDPIALLGRTGGRRVTDSLVLFPRPQAENGMYRAHFFSHGLRYLPTNSSMLISSLAPGDRLHLFPEPENRHDGQAILLTTGDPASRVGYCPRYLCTDFHELIKLVPGDKLVTEVVRVNPDAPVQFRLLCQLVSPWPTNFNPCQDDEYLPLASVTYHPKFESVRHVS